MPFRSESQKLPECVKHTAFLDELVSICKEAGIREALRVAFTGRVPLYHGTTEAIAKSIRQGGLKPQGSPGISGMLGLTDAEKGLSFLTRNPAEAKGYALQAVGLKRLGALKQLVNRGAAVKPEGRVRTMIGQASKALQDALGEKEVGTGVSRILGSFPGGGKRVVKADVPRSILQTSEGAIPELSHNPNLNAARQVLTVADTAMRGKLPEALHPFVPALEGVASTPFLSTVSMKGGIPEQFIKGSPNYKGVSLEEIKKHVADVRRDPRAFGKDVLRAFTGVAHRPSTLIQQNPMLLKTASLEGSLLSLFANVKLKPKLEAKMDAAQHAASRMTEPLARWVRDPTEVFLA